MEMDLTAGSAGKEGTISVEDSADGTGRTNIIIWDMDETLILLKSLLNGSYAANFNGSKNIDKGKEIGKAWEKHILDVCDAFFFYEQVSCVDRASVGTFSSLLAIFISFTVIYIN